MGTGTPPRARQKHRRDSIGAIVRRRWRLRADCGQNAVTGATNFLITATIIKGRRFSGKGAGPWLRRCRFNVYTTNERTNERDSTHQPLKYAN